MSRRCNALSHGADHPLVFIVIGPAQRWQTGFVDMSLVPLEYHASTIRRFAVHVAEAVRLIWARYLDRRARLRDLAALSAMDDLSLKDIGISRLEIRAAMRSGADLSSSRD
jgi:uncharacterized protein YjiS (DUF1127 family)